ncbi:MAG: hypothetical protein AABX30_02180 [Nanoarchaeota archaeon]
MFVGSLREIKIERDLEHYVRFFYSGNCKSSEVEKVENRDILETMENAPENCVSFCFFDRLIVKNKKRIGFVEHRTTLKGEEKNYSGMFYLKPPKHLENLFPNDVILKNYNF